MYNRLHFENCYRDRKRKGTHPFQCGIMKLKKNHSQRRRGYEQSELRIWKALGWVLHLAASYS